MDTSNFKMEMNFESLGDLEMFGEATAPWPPPPLPEEYDLGIGQEYFDVETPNADCSRLWKRLEYVFQRH
jgi:hypothetical protein